MNKIKIAFIKYAGLTAGGSEKLAQIIAANLPKDRFEVDYFACDSAPSLGPQVPLMPTSPERIKYLVEHGVNIVKFKVGAQNLYSYTHDWVDTDFWQVFNECKYDIIQSSRSGHKEYPFFKIRKKPIVDIINLSAGVDNQYNIARVMHICNWSAQRWIQRGGDPNRVEIISLPIDIPKKDYGNLRSRLCLQGKFVFGMHQRPDNSIFSEIPLEAYKQVESDQTAFLLMGGGIKYTEQAKALGLKNFLSIPPTGNLDEVCTFLNTLNVYAHGRKDGEVNSQAMAEAMYFGLPIVSHDSPINNGHVECIGDAGLVVEETGQYAAELKKLTNDSSYYYFRSQKSKERFSSHYELQGQIKKIVDIYENVYYDPFPHPFKRWAWSIHYTQNIRRWLASLYLFMRFRLNMIFLERIVKP